MSICLTKLIAKKENICNGLVTKFNLFIKKKLYPIFFILKSYIAQPQL